MASSKKRLSDLLISLRLISNEQLTKALNVQKESPASLGSILVSLGYISEDRLLSALAAEMGVSAWRLEESGATQEAVDKLPGNICRTYHILPVKVRGDLLTLAMRDPADMDTVEMVRNITGMRIEPVLAEDERLVHAIEEAYAAQALNERLDGYVDEAVKGAKSDLGKEKQQQRAQITDADTRPVVGLVNQILTDAIRMGASDIHVEPRMDRVEIRYRIDGHLVKVREVPQKIAPMLTTRLKIMAELDIVEFRVPQDGRVAVVIDGRHVDLRVSVLPNHHGQRIVLRILDKSISLRRLDDLGFGEDELRKFRSLINKPYGMFLVTGPTGSGKTTTLYAALNELKTASNNIMTCEDPIEYDIDGINQSQVHEKVGLTFAKQLRAILRQDPDIVLVGEIRDGETAQTAIRAALTGHLVLSTLHCNDAPSAIPRLIDMGVDPFLLSTSLIGVMSQRLLRLLCPGCARQAPPTSEDVELLAAQGIEVEPDCVSGEMPMLWEPRGCPRCGSVGFKGRTAVREIMTATPQVAQAIASQAPMNVLKEVAVKEGYTPMQEEAMRLALSGKTTLVEAQRQVFFELASPVPEGEHQRAA